MRKRIAVVVIVLLGIGLCLFLAHNEERAPDGASIDPPVARELLLSRATGAPRGTSSPPAIPSAPIPETGDVFGSLSGLVLRPDGEPAAGARVVVRWRQSERQSEFESGEAPSDAGLPHSVETDVSGRFEITGLLLGWAVVSAEHESVRAAERFHLDTRQPHHDIVLVLFEGDSLGGVVVDGGGAGIGGARVVPLEHDGQKLYKHQSEAGAVLADGNGRFLVDGLRPGEWTLHVSADGFGPVITRPFSTGIRNARVVLGSGVDLDCHVFLRADNSPVAGVTVRLTYEDRSLYPMEVVSDSDGVARFPMLGKGIFRANVHHSRYALTGDAPVVAIDPTRKPDPLLLIVAEGGRVRGHVRDSDSGKGIAGVVISAYREEDSPYYADPTLANGSYEIVGLPQGNYEVSIQDRVPGYPQEPPRSTVQRVTVGAEGFLDGVDFELSRGAILAGTVRDTKGNPVANATVLARNVEGRQNLADCHTGENGHFEFGAYTAGELVRLSAERGPARSGLQGPFEAGMPGSDAIEIVLERECDGVIAGIVVNKSGQPVECQVSAKATDSALGFPVTAPTATTDGHGNFVLSHVCPGEYVISLAKKGEYSQEAQTVHLAAGESVTGLKLVYNEKDLYEISGFVTDEQGDPVEDAHVQARAVSKPLYVPEQSTDVEGAFHFDGLPAGEYILEARARGLDGDGFVVVSAGATDIVLALDTQRFLSGHVKDDRGAPISNFSVTVLSEEQTNSPTASEVADPTGRFSIPMPPSGNWSLRIEAPHRSPVEIDVPAEAVVDGDYEMEIVIKSTSQ